MTEASSACDDKLEEWTHSSKPATIIKGIMETHEESNGRNWRKELKSEEDESKLNRMELTQKNPNINQDLQNQNPTQKIEEGGKEDKWCTF